MNEAMAAGLPVLVSNAAGAARDLVIDGWNGYTFAPGDTEALGGQLGARRAASAELSSTWKEHEA